MPKENIQGGKPEFKDDEGGTPRPVDDPETVAALCHLGRILMEIAETARPTDSKREGKRKSNQRRKKGGQRHDRK